MVSTAVLSQKIKKGLLLATWSALLAGAGTIIFYLSTNGSVWYLGQITATLFILLALNETLGKKRPLVLGLLLSGALLSRLQLLLALPFFTILLFKQKISCKKALYFASGLSFFVIFYCLYNYLRFGNIFQTGYRLIPGILQEPWFNRGQFHPTYIRNHLKILLAGLPKFSSNKPYVYPSWAGLAIWLTSPSFIFAFLAPLKKIENKLAWLSIVLIGLINFSYGSTGFTQFGYRYAVDFYPFLIFLTIKGVARTGLKKIHWLLLAIGIIVNLWGVLWINKFGWVGF